MGNSLREHLFAFFIGLSLIVASVAGTQSLIQVDPENPTQLIMPDHTPYIIKGVAFGNHVLGNPANSDWFQHHETEDFKRVKEMGFNSIRFYINEALFDTEAGFIWLDKNIAAARENNIYLILNMHYPPGGYQSNGDGDALWTERSNQLKLIALWRDIAERYSDEEIILGYGLLNEPVPLDGVSQWAKLAQEIINEIREPDPHHLLFIERAIWLKGGGTATDAENNYFPLGLVDPGPSSNIVYEFHVYDPIGFTHQNASWIPSFAGTSAVYPDPDRLQETNLKWVGFSDTNPTVPSGSFAWKRISGRPYRVSNPQFRIGRAVVQTKGIGRDASVYVDEIIVDEYDESGKLLRRILNPSINEYRKWYFWTSDGSGSTEIVKNVRGAGNGVCLKISGTTADSNAGYGFEFPVIQGNQYEISGRMKGSNIARGSLVRFRIDFYDTDDQIHGWGKQYLEAAVNKYLRWSQDNKVPIYLGEFGTITDSFQNGRGGIQWVSDMLEILIDNQLSYNYHSYHETSFGIFNNSVSEAPNLDYANTQLIELFRAVQ